MDKKFTVKKLTIMAMFLSIALIIYILEPQLPIPVPGVKIGLSNIITLYMLVMFKKRDAFTVMILRIIIGCMFAGGLNTLIYSMSGGLLCFAAMCLMLRVTDKKTVWAVSAAGAVMHNVGQLLAAAAVMRNTGVFSYFFVLLVSAVLTGIFTGIITQILVSNKYLSKLIGGFR